jgi:hypothetical protein
MYDNKTFNMFQNACVIKAIICTYYGYTATFDGLAVRTLATGLSVAGSGPAEDGGFFMDDKNLQRALLSEVE